MKDPVCPLISALCGHPDAGTCWEKYCDTQLRKGGSLPIMNWSGCYRHTSLRAVLTVYVDDFKLAVHKDDEAKAWSIIRKAVKLEDPSRLKQYLGFTHRVLEGTLNGDVRAPGSWLPIKGYKAMAVARPSARGMEYDMASCVEQ